MKKFFMCLLVLAFVVFAIYYYAWPKTEMVDSDTPPVLGDSSGGQLQGMMTLDSGFLEFDGTETHICGAGKFLYGVSEMGDEKDRFIAASIESSCIMLSNQDLFEDFDAVSEMTEGVFKKYGFNAENDDEMGVLADKYQKDEGVIKVITDGISACSKPEYVNVPVGATYYYPTNQVSFQDVIEAIKPVAGARVLIVYYNTRGNDPYKSFDESDKNKNFYVYPNPWSTSVTAVPESKLDEYLVPAYHGIIILTNKKSVEICADYFNGANEKIDDMWSSSEESIDSFYSNVGAGFPENGWFLVPLNDPVMFEALMSERGGDIAHVWAQKYYNTVKTGENGGSDFVKVDLSADNPLNGLNDYEMLWMKFDDKLVVVSGVVKNDAGQPVEGAFVDVTLQHFDVMDSKIYRYSLGEQYTDKEGKFYFEEEDFLEILDQFGFSNFLHSYNLFLIVSKEGYLDEYVFDYDEVPKEIGGGEWNVSVVLETLPALKTSKKEGQFEALYYPGAESCADIGLEKMAFYYPEVKQILGIEPLESNLVIEFNTENQQGEGDWTAGLTTISTVCYPWTDDIDSPQIEEMWRTAIPHEMGHIFTVHLWDIFPYWANEGIAQYVSRTINFVDNVFECDPDQYLPVEELKGEYMNYYDTASCFWKTLEDGFSGFIKNVFSYMGTISKGNIFSTWDWINEVIIPVLMNYYDYSELDAEKFMDSFMEQFHYAGEPFDYKQ